VQKDQALLRAFRDKAAAVKEEELERARKDLQRGTDPDRVLQRLSNNLTNKLIHAPTVAIRNASAEGRADFLEYLRLLYDVADEDTTSSPKKNQQED
jgi:glutamyl-tRNA reductase